ncbi:MAG: DUF1800 domain-containing protein [Saprospiraceae bacterium]|nr:DUF1800 domain-containing protein [Saprospiraceae bacterium]
MLVTNCATGTLAPYVPDVNNPWDQKKVLHLYRRLGFGASPQTIANALSQTPATLVDALIDQAINTPLPPAPVWADWDINDYTDFGQQTQEQLIEWVVRWIRSMLSNSVREKMTLFWSNHLVTKYEAYACPSQLYQYHTLLQQHAFGNFKTLVYEMGKTPAMLVFLNGVQNTSLEPNENYARELYELFTLGQGNGYTQTDIQETARALTGWNGYITYCSTISYIPFLHDNGSKTIFGQTGNWGYDDVIDILFEQRAEQVAQYICTKLYRQFIHPDEVNQDIVDGLAQTFQAHNWELAPVLRQLFKSEHFFDEQVIGTIVKSPTDMMVAFIQDSGYNSLYVPSDDTMLSVTYLIYTIGQELFNPPDVSGWAGNRSWINGSTLTARWQGMDYHVYNLFQFQQAALVNLAKTLSNDSIDPAYITQKIVDYYLPNGFNNPASYEQATAVFKWDVPQNYYDSAGWNLDWDIAYIQVALLLRHISRLPEFQLM